jgi:hypothetical protein
MTVPGIGPIISSAMVAAIGTGDAVAAGGASGGLVVVLLFQGQEILQVDEQIGGSAAVHSQSQAAVLGPNIQIPRERLGLVQDGLRREYA